MRQPWATLIVIGAKRFETRSWKTNYRGELYIHAAKNFPVDCRYLTLQEPFQTALQFKPWTILPVGAIIGRALLVDCARTEVVMFEIDKKEIAFGDYSPNRFAFELERPELFDPIPCKGALGIWQFV